MNKKTNRSPNPETYQLLVDQFGFDPYDYRYSHDIRVGLIKRTHASKLLASAGDSHLSRRSR